MPRLQLPAEQNDLARQAVAAAGTHFEIISAHQVQSAAAIAPQPDSAARYCFIQQLKAAAFSQVAPHIHCQIA